MRHVKEYNSFKISENLIDFHFNEGIFELSKDQIEISKSFYSGKIIKCLVAPYHTYKDMEKNLPYTPSTYLFPERELSLNEVRTFVSRIAKNPKYDEYIIVTCNMNIISDMYDGCVRILTYDGEIVPCPIKTFNANIHSIRYQILENEDFGPSKEENMSYSTIDDIIKKINNNQSLTDHELKVIDSIGEDVIRNRLKDMIGRN